MMSKKLPEGFTQAMEEGIRYTLNHLSDAIVKVQVDEHFSSIALKDPDPMHVDNKLASHGWRFVCHACGWKYPQETAMNVRKADCCRRPGQEYLHPEKRL